MSHKSRNDLKKVRIHEIDEEMEQYINSSPIPAQHWDRMHSKIRGHRNNNHHHKRSREALEIQKRPFCLNIVDNVRNVKDVLEISKHSNTEARLSINRKNSNTSDERDAIRRSKDHAADE